MPEGTAKRSRSLKRRCKWRKPSTVLSMRAWVGSSTLLGVSTPRDAALQRQRACSNARCASRNKSLVLTMPTWRSSSTTSERFTTSKATLGRDGRIALTIRSVTTDAELVKPICKRCRDTGWVHERHLDRLWSNALPEGFEFVVPCATCRAHGSGL